VATLEIKNLHVSIEDKEILDFGRTDFNGEGIWISTSLVEASLDIDFDYLFTELQDLNSLFQRFCNVVYSLFSLG